MMVEKISLPADLTNCDKEPIHIPGFIQSHGFLLVVHESSQIIEKCSDNTLKYLEQVPSSILGKALESLFEVSTFSLIRDLLSIGNRTSNYDAQNPANLVLNGISCDLIIHKSDRLILLEFEERASMVNPLAIQQAMSAALTRIQSANSTEQLLEQVAGLVKGISGYDRVMIYQFHPDGHGEVIVEKKENHLESFLHYHYPASDIPVQARELYKINLVRLIADVNTQPAAILGLDSEAVAPLDLTHSVLRAVSPMHIQYLKNMGVISSFSISLIYNKVLWGLVACHNYALKPNLDYQSRVACRFIGQLFSASLEFRMEEDVKDQTMGFTSAVMKLHDQMSGQPNIAGALTDPLINVLSINNAKSAAIFYEQEWHILGKTPDQEYLNDLQAWLAANRTGPVFHTTRLTHFLPAETYTNLGSGLLAIALSPGWSEMICWFKPEYIQSVIWAGDPDKPVEVNPEGPEGLSPRRSFQQWRSEIRFTSEAWTTAEINTAGMLKDYVIQVIYKKTSEIRNLNEMLRKAYDELDTFTYTISHDLRSPLSAIKNYTELFLEEYQGKLPAEGVFLLNKVVNRADKMETLIQDVLAYTKVGRTGIDLSRVWMKPLLEDIREQMMASAKNKAVKIIVKETVDIYGDKTMIMQLFQNLVGNAVKYSSDRENPVITVSTFDEKNGYVIYKITDNGIGFDIADADKIFELFHRVDNARHIEGSGIGLAIVKRIVEKNGGTIWVESVINEGSIFNVRLQSVYPK
jgi:light-regulated signal transduction histidine kinase (bacteriophytochrome)